MSTATRSSGLIPFIPLVLGIALVAALSAPPGRQARGQPHRPPLLPRKELLRALFAAQQNTVADYFWVRTTEATGRAQTVEEYRDVYDYASLVTDLDPRFAYVYVFAGAVIPVPVGRFKWVNMDESTRILERGVEQHPKHVFMRILLAHNLSFFHQDYRRAADILAGTVQLPGAPRYLSALATRMYAHAGDLDTAKALAESLASAAGDPGLKASLERRKLELELEEVLRDVDAAARAFQAREHRWPQSTVDLLASGDLPRLPVDPLGGQIGLRADGQAYSTSTAGRRLFLFNPDPEKEYLP